VRNVVPPGPTREPPAGSFLVMIVEDEALLALDLELTVLRHGWRVLGPAATVTEALDLLKTDRPDVALLDVNLQGELVTPVVEALRAMAVPFVLASAYSRPDLEAAVLAEVPNIGKPTNERRLIAALATAADV
jgi:two-component system, response regulator PdtaR